MKIFKHANTENWKCPICGTSDDKPVTLIGIAGTQEGNNMQAEQFHVDCIELIYFKDEKGLLMTFKDKEHEKD